MGSYIAKCLENNTKIDPNQLQEIMQNQANDLGLPVLVFVDGADVQCPECLRKVSKEELQTFQGICEICTEEQLA